MNRRRFAEIPPPPTPETARLARALGAEAALALIEAHAGVEVYIPAEIAASSPLALLIGEAAARILAESHGGSYLRVPVARDWRIAVRKAANWSAADIARDLSVSLETVRRARGRAAPAASGEPSAKRQLDLFGT